MKKFYYVWPVIFIILNLLMREKVNDNSMSRYAALFALAENKTFAINGFEEWTPDWARTPDGRIFSNKAPGPLFLTFPVFYPLYLFYKHSGIFKKDEHGKLLSEPRATMKIIINTVTQVLPFAFVVFLFLKLMLLRYSLPPTALHFTALSILLANTVVLFINGQWGHGMASMLLLYFVYFYFTKRPILMSLFFSLALLSDYSVAVSVPFLAIILIKDYGKKVFSLVKPIFLGALIPAILWIWYHVSCFGSPFKIPLHFQRPLFLSAESSEHYLGIFHFTLKWDVVYQLLFGEYRGILPTQPWLLLAMGFIIYALISNKKREKLPKEITSLAIMTLGSFFILLYMNVSFNNWNAGGTAGPRYLCVIFPFFSILMGYLWPTLNKPSKYLFALLLFISILFRAQVWATIEAAPFEPLWEYQWNEIFFSDNSVRKFRFFLFWMVLISPLIFRFFYLRLSKNRVQFLDQ